LTGSGTAHAAPSPAELEAQIDQQWNQLEPVIEKHNMVKANLATNKAKAQQLADQIRPLQEKVDAALSKVSALSARYYMSGRTGAFSALLTSNSPTTFADQLALLDAVARDQQSQIKDVAALKAQYDEAKKPLDALVAQLATQEKELADQEATINAQIKQLNDLRVAAYGTTGGTGSLRPAACPYTYSGGAAAKAAQVACAQIGKPYVFGADGPGSFDCSGLTMYAWGQAGYKLRHYTLWQYQDSKRVSRADLKAGDLVFFYSDMHHMGIYVGGDWFVHAPHSGDVVRMEKLGGRQISGYGRVA
jgi:cell wall-associated NlpC family hydrolase